MQTQFETRHQLAQPHYSVDDILDLESKRVLSSGGIKIRRHIRGKHRHRPPISFWLKDVCRHRRWGLELSSLV